MHDVSTGETKSMIGDRITYLADAEISTTEDFQRGTCCYKFFFTVSMIMFFAGCAALSYFEMKGEGPISGGNKNID